jgi:hypothetical protein
MEGFVQNLDVCGIDFIAMNCVVQWDYIVFALIFLLTQ